MACRCGPRDSKPGFIERIDGVKDFKWRYITEAVMWAAVAAAEIEALLLTERIAVMWFFAIPALIHLMDLSMGKKDDRSGS